MDNGQIGDIVAAQKGYFTEAGLDVEFSPGGPNSSTVPPAISGAAALGQFFRNRAAFQRPRGWRAGQDHRLWFSHRTLCLHLKAGKTAALGGRPAQCAHRHPAHGTLHH